MSTGPWSKPGAKGKPNGHRKPQERPTEMEARILATLRSAIHGAQTFGDEAKRNQPPAEAAPTDWSHRKAEWVCAGCHTHNYASRMDCRRCKMAYASSMQLIPAGSPPPGRKGGTAPSPGGSQAGVVASRPPPVPTPNSVDAAEAALRAAKDASAPPVIIRAWEEELKKRQAAAQAQVPPTIRARLAAATAEANAAMQAREKAQKRVTAATTELQEAQKQLETATAEEFRAAAALRAVTSEVAPEPGVGTPQAALAELLQAVKASQEGQEGAVEQLQAATKAAESTLHPPLPDTQMGDEDLNDEDLLAILEQVPSQHRGKAMARLQQMGVQEEAPQKRKHLEAEAAAAAAAQAEADARAAATAAAEAT